MGKRRVETVCRISNVLIAATLIFFAAFVLCSNGFDWDHFLTAAEVDRRSWLLNSELPLWSYQLCGGVTRAGDPQAFGLSPVFLPVLAFGSFWGLKLLVLLSTAGGLYAVYGLLCVFTSSYPPAVVQRAILKVVALGFVLSNYFLWHFHHGHLTFVQMFLGLGLLYLLLKTLRFGASKNDALAMFLIAFSFFSGGLYHATVFLLVPTFVGLAFFLVCSWIARRGGWIYSALSLRNGVPALIAGALGALAASYKLYFVLSHQAHFPRVVQNTLRPEMDSLWRSVVYQLAPSFDYRFAGVFRGWGPFGIWEYSAFSVNAWIALVGVMVLIATKILKRSQKQPQSSSVPKRRSRGGAWGRELLLLACCLGAAGALFAQQSSLSLHRLMNLAAHGSIRVVGRYQVILSLAAACAAALVLKAHPGLRRAFFRYGTIAVPLLLIANLLSFRGSLRPQSVWGVLSLAKDPLAHMDTMVITNARGPSDSYMYAATLLGGAVLNCYNPIRRETMVSREFVGRSDLMTSDRRLREGLLPWIDTALRTVPESCRSGSYFTQNQIVLDRSCPVGTCLNLNGLNPFRPGPVRRDERLWKYCLADSSAATAQR